MTYRRNFPGLRSKAAALAASPQIMYKVELRDSSVLVAQSFALGYRIPC
jgi:hypothetical protein